MANYAHHHADSGSDLDDIEDEHATLVSTDGGRTINVGGLGGGARLSHARSNGISSYSAAAAARLAQLPQCCCRLTPFTVLVLVMLALGFGMLVPGVLMRLESIASPLPNVLLNVCRQPSSWAARALDRFRNEVDHHGDWNGNELRYDGISLSTSALSVYRGTNSYKCSEEEAYEGSEQVIPLPDTLLYTGVTYVAFLTLPSYVVGGSISMRLYSGSDLLFNSTTSLHLHRYFGLHDVVWLEAAHTKDEYTRVFNPHLAPAPVHRHGVREEDCRFTSGCTYNMRAGMQSLILTSTSFELPTPALTPEEEAVRETRANADARAAAEMHESGDPASTPEVVPLLADPNARRRSFAQDESMLIYATNLTLVIHFAEIIESNELAQRAESSADAMDSTDGSEFVRTREGSRHAPTQFISPDILVSFHQSELSPMQLVGVTYIIRGSILLLAGLAIAYVKYTNDQKREKKHDG